MANKTGWYQVVRPNREVMLIAPAATIVELLHVSLAAVAEAADTGEALEEQHLYIVYHAEEWQVLG